MVDSTYFDELEAGFFRAWLRKLPYLPGASHLHANKPLEGRRYDSLNRVTRQTAGFGMTEVLNTHL